MLIVDTGPLVAIADEGDKNYQACLDLLATASGPLITTELVIAEAGYLLNRELGNRAELALVEMIQDGSLTIMPLEPDDWTRVAELLARYEDLPLGVTDASLIAIAERLTAVEVATLDRRHFRVVRPRHCDGFTLKPDQIASRRRSS